MILLVALAFVSGLATALSPCVLPALPVVLAGSAGGGPHRLAGIAAGFVGSFVLFTLALTAALRAAGLSPTALRNVAIGALVLFGLTLLVPRASRRASALFGPLARLGERIPTGRSGLVGGLLVGVALGLVWTPCAGPIFAAIAAVAATGDPGLDAFAVLTAYAAGAIIPLVAVAYGGRRMIARLSPRSAAARPALGVLMLAAALVIALGLDTRLTATVVEDLPGYTDTLQAFERSGAVEGALDDLRGAAGPSPLIAAARGSEASRDDLLDLPDAGPAPELAGISAEFNTGGEPLSLASLRGRVVLLDFWTYSCVNCVRTLPHLRELDERYRGAGLTIVGVHTPEFLFEGEPGNVERAVRDLGIDYPVVLDAQYETWNAYGNRYWPSTYLIDRRGHVRDLHVGEGDYDRTERLVRRALGLAPAPDPGDGEDLPAGHAAITPESYVGSARIDRVAPPQRVVSPAPTAYRAPLRIPADHLAFDGVWAIGPEAGEAGRAAALELSFRAKDVFLVLDGAGSRRSGRVLIDGRPPRAGEAGQDVGPGGRVAVDEPRLYRLLELPATRAGRLRLELAPGTRAYAFTFG